MYEGLKQCAGIASRRCCIPTFEFRTCEVLASCESSLEVPGLTYPSLDNLRGVTIIVDLEK
jgi:hypothetical protein